MPTENSKANPQAQMAVQCSAVLDILRAETYWTAGIFNSWTEGRGARAFGNCSIKSVDGEFRSKAEALRAAEKAIKDRMLSGVRWDTAKPTASFRIPRKTSEKVGEVMDAMMSNAPGELPGAKNQDA